ncbi:MULTISPECIES: hypothetical protein [Amycolatopsis]|uniref:hypothetical protein n=1 Tax=Amycolatopsis TaxID=1813 RepID=UPI001E58D99F|nr:MULTISPECIES: hypothetical protein [Amycolatopsis]
MPGEFAGQALCCSLGASSNATEKNVTELYALERLAHDNPGQRQSIVNIICAYLRMPFTPSGTQPPAGADAAQVKEHQGHQPSTRTSTRNATVSNAASTASNTTEHWPPAATSSPSATKPPSTSPPSTSG